MMMTYQESNRKYFHDDTVFKAMNKEFISLPDKEVEENNEHLQMVINVLLAKMKDEDPFFATVYNRIAYGGSYYKKTKVGSPDEFDLNIIIKLPINYNLMRIESCFPGFIKIHSGLEPAKLQNNEYKHSEALKKFIDPDMYLNQEKFRRWMESIFSKTLVKLPQRLFGYILLTETLHIIKIIKSGPAFTLLIYVDNKVISVDLVPVLELSHWLPNINLDLRDFNKIIWYAVPKPLDKFGLFENIQLCWRTCFYEQEKEILSKNGKIKPIIRQMKKLRNNQNWKHIASYYIETLCLHELEQCPNLNRESFTSLFMMMLYKFHATLEKKCILYYWNTEFNLISRLNYAEIYNIERRLRNIIISINKNIETDPFIIARYILDERELQILRSKLQAESSKDEESSEYEEFSEDEQIVKDSNFRCIIL